MSNSLALAMVADYAGLGTTPVGGPQVAAGRLVPALAARGVEVIVVAPAPGAQAEQRVQLTERVTRVSVPSATRWSLLTGMRSWRRAVQRVIKSSRADLVHGQGVVPYGLAASDSRGVPSVVTAHGNARADTMAAYGGLGAVSRAYLQDRFARTAIDRASVVVGVNPDWRANLPQRPRRFVYIPNIVDECFYETQPRREAGLVLFTGGARAIKGWPLLAAAWPAVRAAVPDARLLLVGWPAGRDPGLELAREHRSSVAVERWLAPEGLAARMAEASVLVIPSKFEVSPIVLAEAWAVGLPVVVAPVGGLAALAVGAAVVVPRREPAAFAADIARILAGAEEIERLVEEGRRRADAHRLDAVTDAHLALYEELTGEER
jgi:glycosyltransferase involved in cell wall biosynthesis